MLKKVRLDNNTQAFLALLRAGLWEYEVNLMEYEPIDFKEVYRMATEQTVVGLVAAGIEHISDISVPKEVALSFVSATLELEQRSIVMNDYVSQLINLLRKEDIYAILVKGQGIAQCYERPLWRACGDVDLLFSDSNYENAKRVLTPLSFSVEKEYKEFKHLGMTMREGLMVELHGSMHSQLTMRIDRIIDKVQEDVFYNGNVRSWMNGNTQIFLPAPNNDIIFIFTHILHHYYIEGIGLRQICDWCRLLWTYKDSLNYGLLESRICKAGIMKEWKSFGAFAVEFLGMPAEAMPFLDVRGKIDDERCEVDKRLKRKADRILAFVMESGNFGHNRDISYKQKYPFVIRYAMSFWLYTKLAIQRFSISPRNAIMTWWAIVKLGANAAAKAI